MLVHQCKKEDFNQARVIDVPSQALESGQIRLNVERFSFTANNITYAVLGDLLQYWSFFPAADQQGNDASQIWGQIPVWGFATVSESNCLEVCVGEHFFGYFPPAQECVMTPTNVSQGGFVDGIEHRVKLPVGYNVYRNTPTSDPQADNERSMLYPLFVTAYCIHDLLASRSWCHAEQLVIISASSKTSLGVAYALQSSPDSPKSIGLTSARNVDSIQALGLYNQVIDYNNLEQLAPDVPTAIVDMSGNKALLSQLHQHLGESMKFTLNVGITHWGDLSEIEGINNSRSEQFFAPAHIQEMIKRMGPQAFEAHSGRFISESAIKTRQWLHCKELDGLNELATTYQDVCSGTIDANTGLIVVMS